MDIDKNQKLYFLGIAGSGMGSVAGLMQESGYNVIGSDHAVYPPMSLMLDRLGISVLSPYGKENILNTKPDVVVVGNRHSKDQTEVLAAQESGIKLTSFPELLEHTILKNRLPIVMAGTHGKTTTSSLIQHCLKYLGLDAGFLIGGMPDGYQKSFALGTADYFILEGDEYDTAFFDKEAKFLHYCPHFTIINNIEFDHADIFDDLEEIIAMFEKLVKLSKDPKKIIVNGDCPGVQKLLDKTALHDSVTIVSAQGQSRFSDYRAANFGFNGEKWQFKFHSPILGSTKIETHLVGAHNCSNIAMALTLLEQIVAEGALEKLEYEKKAAAAISSFRPPRSRMDLLFHSNQTIVIEDFAHHPSSVKTNLEALRTQYPNHQLVCCFEPANATSRRSIFHDQYSLAFQSADEVLIGARPPDKRLSADEAMNTEKLSQSITVQSSTIAKAFSNNQDLLDYLAESHSVRKKPVVYCFMSPSSFGGIQNTFKSILNNTIKEVMHHIPDEMPKKQSLAYPNVRGCGAVVEEK